jgi:hypothetical protein
MSSSSSVQNVPITFDEVGLRVRFASWRLEDLKGAMGANLARARIGQRLQLMQEFFFHLVGAREVLALLINEKRGLGHDPEKISIGQVFKSLGSDDAIYSMVRELVVDPRKEPFPADPYTESAYIYRAILYRNQVAHRHRTPLHIEVEIPYEKKLFLYLDPRNYERGRSKIEAINELAVMRDQLLNRYVKINNAL